MLTKELEKISEQHTEMLPEEEEALRPYIFNSCVNVSHAGKRGQQMENVKEPNEEETMLAENIVKDHHYIMMIGTMEITMESVEMTTEKEQLLKIVQNKEEVYTEDAIKKHDEEKVFTVPNEIGNFKHDDLDMCVDLAEGEGPYDDWSTTSEGIENCVKFPNSSPIEIIELYRMLKLQRRKLEKQRIYTHDKLLKKEDK